MHSKIELSASNAVHNFYFISLDIYGARMQNKVVGNKLEAWLRFFSSDRPEDIIDLIEAYPEFKPMYEDVYKLCVDTGRVMIMFSEELYELDRNTMKLMVDEMQDEIDEKQNEIDDLQKKLAEEKENNIRKIRKLAASYMKQDSSLSEDKAIEMARKILE